MASLGARAGTAPTELAHAVRDFVATRSRGNALVITYQRIESLFADLEGVRTLHFGKLNGLDAYRDVRTVFVVGRPLPSDDAIWEQTQGLFPAEPIEPEIAAMMKSGALLRGGTGQAISVRRFVDERLEAVRHAITDAAVVQATGRGRAVNRSADSPLDIYVLADVVLPMPVELVPWADVEPNPIEQMLVAKACAALSATDAAKLFGDMFSGMESARRALERVPSDWCRPAGVVEVRYRPAGTGCPIRRALVVAKQMERVRDWITGVIGPLASWELVPAT
jgi:hypothetical protein